MPRRPSSLSQRTASFNGATFFLRDALDPNGSTRIKESRSSGMRPNRKFAITRESLCVAKARFHDLHQKQYGFCSTDKAAEIVNIRIACIGLMSKPEIREQPAGRKSARPAIKNRRDVFIGGQFRETAIYARGLLEPGMEMRGPAIIEQKDSTTLLLPGNVGRIDGYRNILIDLVVGL